MIKNIYLAHSHIDDGNFSYFYNTKEEVQTNRRQFLSLHGLTLDDCVAARLTHSTNIVQVTCDDLGKGMYDFDSGVEGDAMVTVDPKVTLFLLTADCLPMVIYDPVSRALALVHLSTNNTTLGFLPKVIKFLKKTFASNPSRLQVYLGPCIHQSSYTKHSSDFPPQMLNDWHTHSLKVGEEHVAFDLLGRNSDILLGEGVLKSNISQSLEDTYTSDLFFSHRRSQVEKEQEGRFATIARLKSRG